jgi:hypothetical protein
MKVIIPGVVAGIATAALVSLAPAANADSSQTVMIRSDDFVQQLSDTRANGHVDFLKEGLHVWTDGNTDDATGTHYAGYTDKAAEYFSVAPQGIPSSASLTWYGTSPQPGSQLLFDADGSDTTTDDSYNVLVGEPTYGDDYWMSTGSSIYKNHHDLCPSTTGGSGSDCHGTLAQWQAAFPNAKVYAAGFSLGSGIKGDGVVRDIQLGDTDYEFTDEPAVTTVDVTGHATATQSEKRDAQILKVHFVTDALGPNQVEGTKLWFKVTDNDETVYHAKFGADDEANLSLRFDDGTGKHKVLIYKAGEVDQKIVIKTGH